VEVSASRIAVVVPVVLIAVCLGGAWTRAQGDAPEEGKLPRLEKTGVLVPWEDFKKILDEIRAAHPRPTPAPPPVNFALTACQATVVVGPDQARAQVRLELGVQVLNPDAWVEVPIIAEGVALARFDIDGRPASVFSKDGHQRVALRGEGRHSLSLEYLAAVGDNRGSHYAYLRFPQAPVIALDMVVPRPGVDFNVPGAVVRAIDRTGGQTRLRAALERGTDLGVTWFKQIELGDRETKIFGELRTLLSVGEGTVRGTAIAAYTIHGRGADAFRVALPAGITVLDVSAQGMRDWTVETGKAGGPERVLVVRLNYVARGSYELQVAFEQEIKGAGGVTIAAPDLALVDVIRERGYIAVAAATNVEISPGDGLKNATPVDPAELPPDLVALAGQPVLYAFKYLAHPVDIALKVVKHDDLAVKRTIVESARLYTYLSPEEHLITSARYSVKNNRKQYLELAMPDGAEPWGAYLEGRPVKAAKSATGKVLVPLKKTATDAGGELAPFDVELVYYQPRPGGFWGRRRFVAPALDVDALEVQWHLFLPRHRRYGGFAGNLHPDEEIDRLADLRGVESRQGADQVESAQSKRELNKRDRLENDLKDLSADEAAGDMPAAPPPAEMKERGYARSLTQPSNVYSDVVGGLAGGGGVARGVLPVRIGIPTDGVRLSFAGRLLTADEQPRIAMSAWPSAWTLSPAAVFILALLLTLAIVWLRAGWTPSGPPPPGRGRNAAVAAAALALFLLFAANPGARVAVWLGMAAALAGFIAARTWTARRVALGLILCLSAAGAGSLVGPVRPAFAAEAGRRDLPDLHNTEIKLSWQDFKALVEKTYVPPPVDPEPPAEAFFRSAEYTGGLEPGVLTLDGRLVLEVLKKGWVRLPFVPDVSAVLSYEGGGAVLNRNGSQVEVLARGPATFTLKTTLAFGATNNPGANSLTVRLPPAPRSLVNLGAAPMFRELQIEGALAYGTRQGRLFVALPQGGFTVKYTLPFRRAEEKAGVEVKLEPRVNVAAYQLLRLGDGVVSGTLVHDYTVRVAKVDHFDVDLPDGVEIFDAQAPGLESWKVLQRDGQRFLRVKLLAPAEGAVRVVVSFEGAYDAKAGRLPVPRFAPQVVERESGFVAVGAEGAEVELELAGRLLPADVSEIPPDVIAYGAGLIGACKYSGAPDAAIVKISEHEDAPVLTAIIESLNATAVVLDNGTEATWIDLSIKNNRKQFLSLALPGAEVEIWSLLLDGQPAKPKQTGTIVLVPLPRGDGEVVSRVSLVLLRKGPPVRLLRSIEPRLPGFDIPVSEALWTVYLPDGRRYVVTGGRFRPVIQTAPLVAVGGRMDRLAAVPEPSQPSVVAEEGAEGMLYKAQIDQEARVAQQLRQKAAGRKGSLPVSIAIPGGVASLPRVTVGRMLIVGRDDNSFSIRPYPAWLGAALAWLQPFLIGAAGLLLGLVMAGVLERRLLVRAAIPATLLALLPLGFLGPPGALLLVSLITALTWASVFLYRRLHRQPLPAAQ
jgi:hypothetical protein